LLFFLCEYQLLHRRWHTNTVICRAALVCTRYNYCCDCTGQE